MAELGREDLDRLLRRVVPGYQSLSTLERLSQGASQETYRLSVQTAQGTRNYALRRAPDDATSADRIATTSLTTESLLISKAKAANVPVPELLAAVREFLDIEIRPHLSDRRQFLTRVGANAVAMVERELALGPRLREAEQARLQALLGRSGPLLSLRQSLSEALRSGHLPVEMPGLAEHMLQTVTGQLAIDQPRYAK